MEPSNERWSDADFKRERERVLALWPTGKEIDLEEAVDFHLALPETKNYARVVRKAKAEGRAPKPHPQENRQRSSLRRRHQRVRFFARREGARP